MTCVLQGMQDMMGMEGHWQVLRQLLLQPSILRIAAGGQGYASIMMLHAAKDLPSIQLPNIVMQGGQSTATTY
jgi:hypothetical protein